MCWACRGSRNARLSAVGASGDASDSDHVVLSAKPDSVATYRIFVTATRADVTGESTGLTFALRAESGSDSVRYNSVFFGPGR